MSLKTCDRKGRFTRAVGLALALSVSLSGCTTVSNWFADEEELEIRTLKPIDAEFTPQVKWTTDIGEGVDHYFSRLRPVFAYDTLYVADRHGDVRALKPATGDTVWERDLATFRDSGFFASVSKIWSSGESAKVGGITVGDNKLFLGTEDGLVMAMDAKNGEPLWKASIAGEVLAPPALDEGILVVNTGAGVMFGFKADTGEQLWRHESDTPPLTLRGISAPVAANGGALIGTPTGKLQVNLLQTGVLAWETQIATPSGATELERIVDIDTSPLLYGGLVYTISYNGTLAAVELRSGRVVWKREYAAYRNVALQGNQLFVVDKKSNVYALDRRNGVELWSQSGLKGRSLTAAEPVGEHIVVGDNWGYLHWLNAESGKIVARVAVGDDDDDESIFVAPLKVNDAIVAVTRDGVVAAVTTPD